MIKRVCINKACKKEFIIGPSRFKKGQGKFCSMRCRIAYHRVAWRCKFCKKKLLLKKSEAKIRVFCSGECQNAYRTKLSQTRLKKINRHCRFCGKLIQKKHPSLFRQGSGKFCALKCSGQYKSRMSMKKRVKRICLFCEKEFLARKNRVKHGEGKFCSKSCRDKSRRNKETRNCRVCNTPFEVKPSIVKKGYGNHCSDFCRILMINVGRNYVTFYTPEFLIFLRESDVELCPFPPACLNSRASKSETNPWLLCKYHAEKINNCMRARRKKRQNILKKEGLMVSLVVSETQHHHKEVATC